MWDKKSTKIKLKLVFLPFLGSSLSTILLYCLIRWILDIHLNIWPLKDTFWDGIIALILSSAIVFTYMRPKIKLLYFKLFQEKSSNVFYFMMILSLFPTIVTSQAYLSKVSYSVIDINNIGEARQYPKQKYFRVADFNVKKQEVASIMTTEVTGKSQSELLAYLYFATPFAHADNIWLGQRFRIEIDNNLSEEDKNQQLKAFIATSNREYKNSGAPLADYFEYLKNSDVKSGYLQAIASSPQRYESEPYIVLAKEGTLAEAATEQRLKTIRFFIFGMFICLLFILKAKIDKKAFQQILIKHNDS